jgi:nucleoside-diphosphate-sugar epimerase
LSAQVRRFVHFSSTAAMGLVSASPIDEDTPPNPLTPYQRSKREAEDVVLDAHRIARFPGIVLRPCMVYGPGGAGEFARFCMWFSRGVFPRVGLGPNLTPLVHVDDVVQAAWLAGTKGHPGQVYLVAGATSPPLSEIRELVLDALHVRRPYLYVPRWLAMAGAWGLELAAQARGTTPLVTRRNIASVTASRVFDITKAHQELGYAPRVHLRPGIREAVLWYRDEGLL